MKYTVRIAKHWSTGAKLTGEESKPRFVEAADAHEAKRLYQNIITAESKVGFVTSVKNMKAVRA